MSTEKRPSKLLTVTYAGKGYDLVRDELGYEAIRCRACKLVSYSPEDISQRYCGHCHRFHESARGAAR